MTGEERLDRFEQAVTQEFARANQQFAQVDRRFAEVDRRFDQVDQRFAEVDRRFDQVDQRFAEVDRRFDQVDQRFAEVDRRFEQVEAKVDKLDAKIDGVNTSLRVLIEDGRSQTLLLAEAIDTVGRRLDRMEAQHQDRHAEVMDFFHRIAGNHEVRIQRLEEHTGLTPGRIQE